MVGCLFFRPKWVALISLKELSYCKCRFKDDCQIKTSTSDTRCHRTNEDWHWARHYTSFEWNGMTTLYCLKMWHTICVYCQKLDCRIQYLFDLSESVHGLARVYCISGHGDHSHRQSFIFRSRGYTILHAIP